MLDAIAWELILKAKRRIGYGQTVRVEDTPVLKDRSTWTMEMRHGFWSFDFGVVGDLRRSR
jgi:hypothetical protein